MDRKRWEPTEEDYGRVWSEQNPWFETGGVPEALAPPGERPLARQLWKRLSAKGGPRRFQVVLGPRRVGKSTSLYQTVRHLLNDAEIDRNKVWWLRLDHPLWMNDSLDRIVRLLVDHTKATAKDPMYLFLDELTYAKDWDLWLKTFYDEQWPVRIAASSSSTAALRDRHLESGVGRWEEPFLAPYLFSEFLELVGEQLQFRIGPTLGDTLTASIEAPIPLPPRIGDLRRRFVLTGGFPELLIALRDTKASEENQLLNSQRTLRTDAVERAIYKDIPQAFGVENPLMLERLLYVLAGQVANILSPTNLCRELGMSQPTFDKYVSYLERAFLVFQLPNYSGSEVSVQRRGRKLYFVDGAVRNAALQRGLAPLSNPAEMGTLLENMIASHLYALSQQTQIRVYHWRDKEDEVDLIYDQPERPLAFEITGSRTHTRRGLRNLVARYPRFKGGCYMVSPEIAKPVAAKSSLDGIGSIPLDSFLLLVGAQAADALAQQLNPRR